jgi:tetratricopeptide (TPR) repeat protein
VAVGAGLIVLARTCVVAAPGDDPAKRDRRRAAVAAACWIVVVTLLVTAWAPLARIRYFLPPALAVGILFAIGFAGVSMLLLRRAFDRGRIAIAAIALALGTAGVYGVVDPTVLDLQRLGVPVSREGLEAYRDSASRHPDSSLRHRRLGFLLMYAGEPESAVDELNVALQLLPTETRDVKIAVQRAITAYDLARAYARAGDHQRSLAALRQHLSIVNELRGRVLDPYVRREFDAVIAERTPGSP